MNVDGFLGLVQQLWQNFVEPPAALKDPERRQRARLLNSILAVFIPLSFVVLVIQFLTVPVSDFSQSSTPKAILMGIVVALLIYLINHTRFYRLARYFTVFIGFVAVIVNALASVAPHIEIAYLVMLPLMGTLLLPIIETLLVCILTIIAFVVFTAMVGDMPPEIIKDLLTFMVFVQVFILFLSQQRNRLEADRQALAVAKERNSVLKELIANLSHDFRTPLSVITTSLYLFNRTQDPAKQQEKLDEIQRQTQRLDRFLDDILKMSVLGQNPDQNLQRTNANEILRNLGGKFRGQAADRQIELNLDLDEALDEVLINLEDIQLGFANLIENALVFTEAGGQVTLRSTMRGDQVVVEVVDTGIGISPEDLASVFTPFFRADQSRSSLTGGMGLGLAIAQQIVELHEGQIEVDSVLGQGSTFRVLLPASPK